MFRHVNESLTRATSVASVPVRGGVFGRLLNEHHVENSGSFLNVELEQGILQHDGSFLLGGQELAVSTISLS